MKDINYSIIIPHKNSAALLERCIKSIPQREDLEIIVVDDNSNDIEAVKKVIEKFKKAILLNNKGFGAGGARNTALLQANGKWVVFADADDFFVPDFLDVLDSYLDKDIDIVYHPALAVDSDTLEPLPELLNKHNLYFEEYKADNFTTDQIKYRLHSPWWKIVKRDFLMKYSIKFEEVPKGNDIFFSFQIGFFTKKIAIDRHPIYVHTYNRNGISYGKKTVEIRLNSLIQRYKVNEFYSLIGHPEWKKNVLHNFYEIMKYDGVGLCFKTFISFLMNYHRIQSGRNLYVESLENRNNVS